MDFISIDEIDMTQIEELFEDLIEGNINPELFADWTVKKVKCDNCRGTLYFYNGNIWYDSARACYYDYCDHYGTNSPIMRTCGGGYAYVCYSSGGTGEKL